MSHRIAQPLVTAALALALVLSAPPARAADAPADTASTPAATPLFAFAAWVVDGGGGPGLVHVRCHAVARVDSAAITAHVRALPPLVWAFGDTLRVFRQGRANATWEVAFRAPRGPYAIEGVGAAERADGGDDEVAWRLEGRAPAGGDALPTARLLYEHRRLGRLWFRADGPVLVPVDSSERCVDDDIIERARATATAPVNDALLYEANDRRGMLDCVVCVDARGRLTAVRPTSGRLLERAAHAQLLRDLRTHWAFAPARTRRGPVADCLEAEVQVAP